MNCRHSTFTTARVLIEASVSFIAEETIEDVIYVMKI